MDATSVKPPDPEPLMSPDETAAYLGVSKEHLRRLRKAEQGPPYIRVSERVVRYRLADVQAWVDARRKGGEGDGSGLE